MAPPDDATGDLEARVSLLEREVARLREQAVLTTSDAGAARVLAAGADHDVAEVRAELRAHTSALNALRETQLEQAQTLSSLRETQLDQGHRLDSLEQRVTDGFATVNAGMNQIVGLLNTITGPGQN